LESLADCTLLHEDRMLANWEQWFALAGVERTRSGRGPAYSHGSMAIKAAIRGEGVVLGRSALVTNNIAAGVTWRRSRRYGSRRNAAMTCSTATATGATRRCVRHWLAEEIRMFLADGG
jgi:LysR family glycine cleavage system transcriptional activator